MYEGISTTFGGEVVLSKVLVRCYVLYFMKLFYNQLINFILLMICSHLSQYLASEQYTWTPVKLRLDGQKYRQTMLCKLMPHRF